MTVSFTRNVEVTVHVSAFDLGHVFAEMGSDEQAQFFNGIASATSKWAKHPGFQWQMMREDLEGLPAALEAFKAMAEYAEDAQ